LGKAEILDFVKTMQVKDHAILFYSDRKDKRDVLFTYLKAGLDTGEAAVYVASEESPDKIRQAMKVRLGLRTVREIPRPASG
jgi:hypothetical protein